MELVLLTRPLGEHVVLELNGPLDFHTAPTLWEALWPTILCADSPRVILDLSSVDFMDSTGLSVMIDAWRQAEQRGGSLRLARAQRQAAKVLRITSLDLVLPIYASAEDAAAVTSGDVAGSPSGPEGLRR